MCDEDAANLPIMSGISVARMRTLRRAGSPAVKLTSELVSRMDRAECRDDNQNEHDHDVNAQSPEQRAHANGKMPAAKMRPLLCRDDLVCFQQREYDAWIP